MNFRFVKGKNYRDFVKICNISTKQDFELYDVIKNVLRRKEYFPYLKGNFNKYLEYSYLFNDYIFPYQFFEDVKKVCLDLPILIPKENCELIDDPIKTGVYPQIKREDFDNWLNKQKFPDDIFIDKEEYKYQPDSAFEAINRHVARITIATSGGKTFLTYLYCKSLVDIIGIEKKILIIVPSVLLAKQLKKDFEHFDSLNEEKLLVETIYSGSKKVADAKIVCGTYQSLSNYDVDYFDDFGACICDELHRAKAYSIRNGIYSKMRNSEYFFGMTGTFPEYKSLDYIHIVSMFGPEIINVSVKDLINSGISNNVEIKSIVLDYYKDNPKTDENRIMDFEDIMNEFTELCPEYELPDDIDENPSKRYYAEKHYFQMNTQRMAVIAKLLNKFEENTIIFTDTVQYCNELYDYLTARCEDRTFNIIHGKVKNRTDIIEEMKNTPEKYVIIATYGTMSTGISIKNLTNAYIVDGGKSTIRIKQSLGRLMRILDGKKTSKIFDFYDNLYHSSFRSQSNERLKIYRNEKLKIDTFHVSILK